MQNNKVSSNLEQFAELDYLRFSRLGIPEAIYSPGKTPEQVVAIAYEMCQHGNGPVMATRADKGTVDAVLDAFSSAEVFPSKSEFPDALKTVVVARAGIYSERVCIVTGGSTDLVVAGEVAGTLTACGVGFDIVPDVGVSGLHRLLSRIEEIKTYDAVIVLAGMEGALASVLGGLVSLPIVAVPTSTGYGSSAQGATAMMSMLASCAPGIAVVGVDNGFGAACSIIRIVNLISKSNIGRDTALKNG